MHSSTVLRSFTKSVLITVFTVGALSACQTSSRTGQGELALSSSTVQGLKTYMNQFAPRLFVASTDGKSYSYYYCPGLPCKGTTPLYHKAIKNCEQRSNTPCKFLALQREIVWLKPSGEAYTLDEIYDMPSAKLPSPLKALHVAALCTKAIGKNTPNWSEDDNAKPYVKEAIERGLSSTRCAHFIE